MSLSRRRRRRMLFLSIENEKVQNNLVVEPAPEPNIAIKNEENLESNDSVIEEVENLSEQVNAPAAESSDPLNHPLEVAKLDDAPDVENEPLASKKKGKRFGKD